MTNEDPFLSSATGRNGRPPVLVIGGTGHVGASLCQFLSARGHPVTAASRSQELVFDDSSIKRLELDLLAHSNTDRLPNSRVAIICPWVDQPDSAGFQPWLDHLVQLLVEIGTRSFIYVSSVWVYGREPKGRLTESMPAVPTDAYGLAHAANEAYLAECADELGADVTILRLANLAGPDPFFGFRTKIAFAHELVEMAFRDRSIVLRSPPSTPRNMLPGSLFHHDIGALLDRRSVEGRVDTFNLGSGSTSTMIGLAREIAVMAEGNHGDPVSIEHPEESETQTQFHLDTTKIRLLAGVGVDDLASELSMILQDVAAIHDPISTRGKPT